MNTPSTTKRKKRSGLFASSAPATVRPADPPTSAPTEVPPLDPATTPESLRASALDALRQVYDPELGIDIVAMGLVYDVRAELGPDVPVLEMDMTLTTPGCPVSESLPQEADSALRAALPGVEIHVQVVWDPPWTPERLDSAAMDSLGLPPR